MDGIISIQWEYSKTQFHLNSRKISKCYPREPPVGGCSPNEEFVPQTVVATTIFLDAFQIVSLHSSEAINMEKTHNCLPGVWVALGGSHRANFSSTHNTNIIPYSGPVDISTSGPVV